MSKKRSNTSRPPEPPPVLYLDENLSSHSIAEDLRGFPDWDIQLHYDHFDPRVPDVDLIAECCKRGWIMVSRDERLRSNPRNRAAWKEHCARIFLFSGGNHRGKEYSAALIAGRCKLVAFIRKTSSPFFARIHFDGRIQPLEPKLSGTATARERTALKYGANVFKVPDEIT